MLPNEARGNRTMQSAGVSTELLPDAKTPPTLSVFVSESVCVWAHVHVRECVCEHVSV